MRKGPGFITRMYGTGRKSFLKAAKGYSIRTPQPANKMGEHMLSMCVQSRACAQDFAQVEAQWDFAQVEAQWDFAQAAESYLATVSADPRNHFGKYALRRFDK